MFRSIGEILKGSKYAHIGGLGGFSHSKTRENEEDYVSPDLSIYCEISDCSSLWVEEEMHEGMRKKICWEHYEGSR